jgi:hypothetical protein
MSRLAKIAQIRVRKGLGEMGWMEHGHQARKQPREEQGRHVGNVQLPHRNGNGGGEHEKHCKSRVAGRDSPRLGVFSSCMALRCGPNSSQRQGRPTCEARSTASLLSAVASSSPSMNRRGMPEKPVWAPARAPVRMARA